MLTFIFIGMAFTFGGFSLGAKLIGDGHYPWGVLLIALSLLIGWLFAYTVTHTDELSKRSYPYTPETCPHRGERPNYGGLFRRKGYYYRALSSLDDWERRVVVECNQCGLNERHDKINPLGHTLRGESYPLPIHP